MKPLGIWIFLPWKIRIMEHSIWYWDYEVWDRDHWITGPSVLHGSHTCYSSFNHHWVSGYVAIYLIIWLQLQKKTSYSSTKIASYITNYATGKYFRGSLNSRNMCQLSSQLFLYLDWLSPTGKKTEKSKQLMRLEMPTGSLDLVEPRWSRVIQMPGKTM